MTPENTPSEISPRQRQRQRRIRFLVGALKTAFDFALSAGISMWRRGMSHKCCTALLLLVTINVLSILWPRIRPQSPSIASPPTLVSIANTENKDRRADVIFVHGLGGDGHHTWESLDGSKFYWPQALGEDLNDVGIWAVNYESAASHWLGYTMPIESRALHLLQVLKDHGIGERRIVFIGHSLGGIVVKQMIQDASDLGLADYSDIAIRTRGVIFLGTPNTGSDLPSAQKMIEKLGIYTGATVTQDQLVDNSPILLRLNLWYRNRVESMEIKTQAFAETKPFNGVIVVDQSSADPQVAGIAVVPVPENHQTICKPASKQADVYVAVKRFIDEHVVPLPSEYKSTLQEAVTEISLCRNDPARLEQFKEAHVGQEVVWEGFVQKVTKDKKDSYCTLSLRGDTDPFRWVVASFRYWNFKPAIAPGATIKVRGILKKVDETNILISECRLVP